MQHEGAARARVRDGGHAVLGGEVGFEVLPMASARPPGLGREAEQEKRRGGSTLACIFVCQIARGCQNADWLLKVDANAIFEKSMRVWCKPNEKT